MRSLVEMCATMSYFSRGSITYNDVMELTSYERDIINEFQNKHIRQQLKMPHPVY